MSPGVLYVKMDDDVAGIVRKVGDGLVDISLKDAIEECIVEMDRCGARLGG